MRILIVAATLPEVAPLMTSLGMSLDPAIFHSAGHRGHTVDVLVTGVGMVATAARASRALARTVYDVAFNFGVCGSFDPTLFPGTVVHVTSDRIPELGAEDGDDAFLTAQQLQLVGAGEFPFTGGRLVNQAPPVCHVLEALPSADGITVNTVHGADKSISAVVDRYAPQVESMEGAAFMYSCLVAGVSFAQVRAVSNMVERRNRAAWKMPEAIAILDSTAVRILETL